MAAIDWHGLQRRMARRSPAHGEDAVQSVAEKMLLGRFDRYDTAEVARVVERSAVNALTDLQRRGSRLIPLATDQVEADLEQPCGFEDQFVLAAALQASLELAGPEASQVAALILDADLTLTDVAAAADLTRTEVYWRLRSLRTGCLDLDPRRPSRRGGGEVRSAAGPSRERAAAARSES